MADPGPPETADRTSPAARGSERAEPETLGDLGEWELIRRLAAFAPAGQFADDAALLPLSDNAADPAAAAADSPGGAGSTLVINTDVLVEGIHFSEATTGAMDVGWRAAAANLSDLAAMGASQVVGLTVGLVAPGSTPWPWVEGVYRGLAQALTVHGGILLGGDCSGGAQRLLAVTALGRIPAAGGPIRRADGRPGDRLLSTGPHGLSRLGLALLQEGVNTRPAGSNSSGLSDSNSLAGGLNPALIQRAITAHRRPVPRFDAVRALLHSRPDQTAWRVAGCDSSDGLVAAAAAIAAASGCQAQLDRDALPLDPAMAALPQGEAWCLGGGEDFELVLALQPAWAEALLAALPGARCIGQLHEGNAGTVSGSDGGSWLDATAAAGGYQHFH